MEIPNNQPTFLPGATFVAFDTETTGMWAPINRIVEIAAVKFRLDSEVISTFQSLVNPLMTIPAEVIEIHGITDEMVRDAPRVDEALVRFMEFCGGESVLVAHNAPFDISFLGTESRRYRLPFADNPILDTVDIYHRFFPGLASYSLLNLIRHFNLSAQQEHRALSDAQFVRRLFVQAARKFPPVTIAEELKDHFTVYRMSDWQAETVELPLAFADLAAAMRGGKRVQIDYNHPVRNSSVRVIHPREVYKLGSIYYINAFCEFAQAERTFRLDRILKYTILPE